MKILVVYYSRTGNTKKVAKAIASTISADLEEVRDTADRSGAKGYFIAGKSAMQRKHTKIEPIMLDPSIYDLVIIGTPVWSWNVSVPVRTYLFEQKNNFKNVAFFCTMGGSGGKRSFIEMESIIEKKPFATLSVLTKEAVANNFSEKIDYFLGALQKKSGLHISEDEGIKELPEILKNIN